MKKFTSLFLLSLLALAFSGSAEASDSSLWFWQVWKIKKAAVNVAANDQWNVRGSDPFDFYHLDANNRKMSEFEILSERGSIITAQFRWQGLTQEGYYRICSFEYDLDRPNSVDYIQTKDCRWNKQ